MDVKCGPDVKELDSVSGAKEMYPVSLQRCGLMEKR
jgi:hypothetical protein